MNADGRFGRYLAIVLLVQAMAITLAWSIVYLGDPLQRYRKSANAPRLDYPERYVAPGLARFAAYDAVIVGTSNGMNFSPAQIQRVLGWKTLKLAVSGGTAHEQAMLLRLALGTGQVKNVLWGIDPFYFGWRSDHVREDQGLFPWFLYEPSVWGDLRYYAMNRNFIQDSLKILLHSSRNGENALDIAALETWNTSLAQRFGADLLHELWNETWCAAARGLRETEPFRLERLKQSAKANLEATILAHPDVRFELAFVPHSILWSKFLLAHDRSTFDNLLAFKKQIYGLASLPNVAVFDFEMDFETTRELGNYSDLAHYSRAVNDRMIDHIAANRFRMQTTDTEQTLDRYRATLDEYPEPKPPTKCPPDARPHP